MREEQRQHVGLVNECLKVSVGVLWVATTFLFFPFFFLVLGTASALQASIKIFFF